jgi:fumarylacetoacetate (FAA) hydrolase
MRICTFVAPGAPAARCGVVDGDRVTAVDVPDVVGFLASGLSAGSGRGHDLADVRLLAPVPEPPAVRDFFAFEQHVATARGKRGRPVPEFWYREPVFYFTNPAAVIGPGDDVPRPAGTLELDYELEVAAVVGADEAIAGFTVMNDWSARDVQRAETSVGLGPAKAKDFATTLGPWLVTADEFPGTAGLMTATVNGAERSRGDLASMHFGWDAILERAARDTRLRPGDVLGSGTVGTGCILESPDERWLRDGDLVTLSVQGIGSISNTVVASRASTRAGAPSERVP